MNSQLCQDIATALESSSPFSAAHSARSHINDLMSGYTYAATQREQPDIDADARSALPAVAIRMRKIVQEIKFSINECFPDHVRYLLSQLIQETADELRQLLDTYDVHDKRTREELQHIQRYADECRQGFIPLHEQI